MTVDEALAKLPEILKRDLEQNLCVCNDVVKIKVIEAIAMGADSLQQVQSSTYAADGSGCCKRQVQALIDAIHQQE